MEKIIIFGCVYSFEDRSGTGDVVSIIEYMQVESGKTFKSKITNELADNFRKMGLKAGDLVTGIFGLNEYNRVTLIGISEK